jgi:hypothetical protein
VGPTTGLDDVEKNFAHTRARALDTSAVQLVAIRYTDCAIPAPRCVSELVTSVIFELRHFVYDGLYLRQTNNFDMPFK